MIMGVCCAAWSAVGASADAKVHVTQTGGTVTITMGPERTGLGVQSVGDGTSVWVSARDRDDDTKRSSAMLEVRGCTQPPELFGTALCEGVTSVDIAGGPDDDELWLDDLRVPATVRGGEGNDEILAGRAADVVDGGPGNDLLTTRDGVTDVVTCGSGSDAAKTDVALELGEGCEGVQPQILGQLSYHGNLQVGATATLSDVTALGTPGPVLTYGWRVCNYYSGCKLLSIGKSHTFTVADISAGSQYRSGIDGYAEAENAFGKESVSARWDGQAVPYAAPDWGGAGTGGATQTTVGPASADPSNADHGLLVDPAGVARGLLRGAPVPIPGLTNRSLAAYRRAAGFRLSSRAGAAVALVCSSGLCQVTLHPELRVARQRPVRLAVQRFRVRAGDGVLVRVRLTAALRHRLRRARRGTLRFAGTLRVAGVNSQLRADIPVA